MMKRKRLFYLPGLISIIGLPILLTFLGPEDKVYSTAVRLRLPSEKKDTISNFTKSAVYDVLKNKRLSTINLDQHEHYEVDDGAYEREEYVFHRRLGFVRQEIEHLQFTGDTNTVVQVQLGETNTYGEFVGLFTLGRLYQIRKFVYMDNSFYFFANPSHYQYPREYFILDSSYLKIFPIHGNPVPKPPTKWDIFKRDMGEKLAEVSYSIRRSWVYVLGFLLLIVAPSLWRARRWKRIIRS